MNKIVPIFFLLFFLACNNHEIDLQKQASPPKTVEAKGYVVPKDSMAEPKVIPINESKLKKVPVGNPKVVATNLNVHTVGVPKIIPAGNPKIITPGKDTFSLPKIVPTIDSPFVAKQPKPIPALPFRMKDAATCNIQYLDVDQGMNSSYVRSILEDKSGNLWFGTHGGGVSKYDGKTFTHYTEKEGLSNNYVWSILEDKSGNLWFGTDGGGVSKYDGKTFTHYTEKEGLSNNYVWSIIEDKSVPTGVGIWLSTVNGLNCFVVEPVLSLSKGGGGLSTTKLNENKEIINPKIQVFHKEDGLKAEDFFQNSVLLDSKNRIWWGSGKALTMLDLNEFSFNEKEPQIQLDNIYLQENFVDYRHLNDTVVDSSFVNENSELKNIRFSGVANFHNYPEDLELPYYLNHLTFHFSAIDRYAPHKIKYQYKLEGLDDDWSNLTAENKADYRNIPYGNYTFKVKAIGSAGKWSKTFEYNFTIHPPWWLTWWAYTLYGVFTIVLVVVIVRWNGKKLRARAEELKVKVDEATQEIKEQKAVVEEQKAVVEEQKKHIEERHKEITDSINYAERIQRSLLASKKLLDENSNEYFIFFKPKDVVSGDFYWATTLNNGHFTLICADSTGHGVPGAIMSILNIACLKETSMQGITNPDLFLNETRRLVIENLKNDGSAEGGKDGMDGSLLSFDFKNSMLQCACANNPIWIIRGQELIEIKSDRFPIGKHDRDKEPFTLHTIQLQKGDAVYALTDGFSDQFGGLAGKKFKYKQLQELLISMSAETMAAQKQKLNEVFEEWKGNLEQVDDVTIVGVRV